LIMESQGAGMEARAEQISGAKDSSANVHVATLIVGTLPSR